MPATHNGFRAVILCGPGTSLYPFTASEDLPKALLPIANKPMISYPLEWCEKAGFESVLVLTLTEHLQSISSYLRSHRISKTSVVVQVEAASSLEDNLGTADVIRVAYQNGWLKSDFAVVPCDVVTNLDGGKLVEMWMCTQAGFDSDLGRRARKHPSTGDGEDGRRGAMAMFYQTMGEGAVKGQETDFLAVAPTAAPSTAGNGLPDGEIGTLLDTTSGSALKGVNEIPIRYGMLKKHANVKLYSTYRDSGIYFFAQWVLRFIEGNPKMNSLREDILPWLAKSGWQNHRLAEKLRLVEVLSGSQGPGKDSDSVDTVGQEHDIGSMSTTRKKKPPKTGAERTKIPPVVTYLPSSPSLFMRRVDTPHLYLYTSLYLAKSDPTLPSMLVKVDPSAYVGDRAIVTSGDCLIADKVSIGERSVIKKSVLGTGVSIGRGARIMGCVLMDGASVAENAKLEGCTIGRKANIGAKASLKDCEIADGYMIEDGADAKGERFVAFAALEPGSSEDGEEEEVVAAADKSDVGDDDDDDDEDDEDDEDYVPSSSDGSGSSTMTGSTGTIASGDEQIVAGTAE